MPNVLLGWATDIHLDFLIRDERAAFYDRIVDSGVDGLIVTGDISTATQVGSHLHELARDTCLPLVAFVLGNHDFYGGDSIPAVRREVAQIADERPNLVYLRDQVVDISNGAGKVFLVGVDGWSDARTPCFASSSVRLQDYRHIRELHTANRRGHETLGQVLEYLGRTEAMVLAAHLAALPLSCTRLIVATHPPPFRGACWHQGEVSNDEYAPHFTCVSTGEVIEAWAKIRPTVEITVLCGHTHGGGTYSPADNIEVHTGEALYGHPAIQSIAFNLTWDS